MVESLEMLAMWLLIAIMVIWWASQLIDFLNHDKPRIAALWLAAGVAVELVILNKLFE